MSDSDHHHRRLPNYLLDNDSTIVMYPIRKMDEHKAALAATTILDEATLRSLEKCSQVLHDIVLFAPSNAVRERDEDAVLRLAADVHALGQWLQTVFAAFSSERRAERRLWLREFATSPSPAPPPLDPAPTPDVGAKLTAAPTPDKTRAPPTPKSSTAPPQRESARPSIPAKSPSSIAPPTARATPQPAPPTPRATPQPESPPRSRLIVRYSASSCPPLRPHPRKLVQSLNSALGRDLLAAVSYSRDDQLVLHTKAPYTVQQLLTRDKIIRTTLDSLLYPTGSPKSSATFDTGEAWSKLVLHQVPLPVWRTKTTPDQQIDTLLADLCVSNGLDKSSVRRFRTLCALHDQEKLFQSSTERAPQHVSLLLCTTDHDAAARILRSGVIVQSAFCRTSTFRPRSRPDATAAA